VVGDVFESNPELVKQLKDQCITHLVAVGIQSECCVKATSKGALANGFQVSLLKGAHSTYNTGDATALEIEKEVEDLLEGLGAKIVPYGDAVKAWKAAGAVC
jgi:nicotinamidase-related amidase